MMKGLGGGGLSPQSPPPGNYTTANHTTHYASEISPPFQLNGSCWSSALLSVNQRNPLASILNMASLGSNLGSLETPEMHGIWHFFVRAAVIIFRPRPISANHGSSSMNTARIIYSKTSKQKKEKLNYTFTQKSVNLLSNFVTHFRHKSIGISNEKHSWQYLTRLTLLVLTNFIKLDQLQNP